MGALSTATGVPLLAPGAAQARAHAHLAGKAAAVHALKHMMADFRQLLTNVNYLKLLFGFSVGVGLFNALLTILSQVLRPCGYGDDVASIGGGVLLGCGLASAVALGLLLEKTRAYVPLLKVGITLAVGACAFFLASLHPGNNAQIIASLALLGICLLPLLPLSLENAAECTYPIPEDNSAALMLFLGQMWGIMFIFVFNHLLENWPVSMHCTSIVTPFAGMMLFSLAAASAVMLLFGKDYRRQSAETSKSANIQHDAMGAALGTHVVLA
ncbi:hypothetical protein EON66_09985 [archaeon]|nr:MAG: hypothetical protein EON66_09985 [archaeon]